MSARDLHHAAMHGCFANVAQLMQDGMDPLGKTMDEAGFTPFHWAIITGKVDVMAQLLSTVDQNRLFETSDNYGNTLLHIAAGRGLWQITKLLLKIEPRLPFVQNGVGRTPLHLAASYGDLNVVKLLVKIQYKDLLTAPDRNGDTPLQVAKESGYSQVAEFLEAAALFFEASSADSATSAETTRSEATLQSTITDDIVTDPITQVILEVPAMHVKWYDMMCEFVNGWHLLEDMPQFLWGTCAHVVQESVQLTLPFLTLLRNKALQTCLQQLGGVTDDMEVSNAVSGLDLIDVCQHMIHRLEVHFECICDGCQAKAFQGPRWKSLILENYDLCQHCFHSQRRDRLEWLRLTSPLSTTLRLYLSAILDADSTLDLDNLFPKLKTACEAARRIPVDSPWKAATFNVLLVALMIENLKSHGKGRISDLALDLVLDKLHLPDSAQKAEALMSALVDLFSSEASVPVKYLFCGNPGVGKSTILNCLIGEGRFQSGTSYGEGLTKGLQRHQPPGHPHTYFDTPGLADINLESEAASAIHQALKEGGRFKVAFVLAFQNGRIKPEDVDTMKRVLTSAPIKSYGIIVNKVPGAVLDSMTVESKRSILEGIIGSLPANLQSQHIFFIKRDDDLEDQANAVKPLPPAATFFLYDLQPTEIDPEQVRQLTARAQQVELQQQALRQREEATRLAQERQRLLLEQQASQRRAAELAQQVELERRRQEELRVHGELQQLLHVLRLALERSR